MNTTISISKDTRDILQEFGKKSESYDDVIRRMYNDIKLREEMLEYLSESEYSTVKEAREWPKLKIDSL